MSQYPSLPPPGPYVPPTGGSQSNQSQGYNPQQQPPYGQAQASSPYQSSSAPGYGPPGGPPQKPLSQMNQMFNQAVTTGKPMLNKLGKTISSKLGSKHSGPSTPQHLENYQNYQQHYQQGPGQGYPNQPSQQSQSQNAYPSPPQQSTFSTPLGSTHSGQSNYFPQQGPQSPDPQQQPNAPPYNPNQFGQGGNAGTPQPGQAQEGQFGQGQYNQGQAQQGHYNQEQYNQGQLQQPGDQQGQLQQSQFGQGQHGQPPQVHFDQNQYGQGQQQPHGHFTQDQYNQGQFQQPAGQPPQGQFNQEHYNHGQAPQPGPQDNSQNQGQQPGFPAPYPASPDVPIQPGQQNQWSSPTPGHDQFNPALQQQQSFNQNTPVSQQPFHAAPALPVYPNYQQHHHTPSQTIPPQSAPTPPVHPNQPQQQQQPQTQQWAPMSPVSPHTQTASPVPPAVSPPPGQHQQTTPPPTQTVAPQKEPSQSAPTEFIAELPADLGNMTIAEAAKPQRQASPYQAYQPPGTSPSGAPSPAFTIPRRAVSISNRPLAEPWGFADAATETPSYECYILADLLFDALDKTFEPKNSGLLEASKIVGSWWDLNEEARRVYTYNGYSALARHYSLLKVPHIMVPVESDMRPLQKFDQSSQAHELKVPTEPCTDDTPYTSFMPALNRAGWYKFFFINALHEPEDVNKSLAKYCADTYKPGVLNHPDFAKRDKSGSALETRAAEVNSTAIRRVYKDTRAVMQTTPDPTAAFTQSGGENMTAAEMAVRMHKIQMERNFNDMAVRTVLGSGIMFGGGGGYSGGYASLV